jgi:membrane-bound metal-dependent hydrolase YbcI (DUF457 family)
MPSTFTHGFLPAACVFSSKAKLPKLTTRETLKLLFASAVLGNACDSDLVPAFMTPAHWLEIHRYWGHNIFSITLWIVLGAWAIGKYVSPQLKGKLSWILASCLVWSHVLFDSMGDYSGKAERVGVPLLWPFSNWEFYTPFPVFKSIRIDPKIHPALAHATSNSFWHDAVYRELTASVIMLGLWVIFFWGYHGFAKLAKHYKRSPRKDEAFTI